MKKYLAGIGVVLLCLLYKLAAAQSQTVPDGGTTQPIAFPNNGCFYQWTNDHPEIGLPASGNGDIASFTAINKTASPITATITATPVPLNYAYITNFGDNTVSVINTVTNTVEKTIPVGANPGCAVVSPDGSKVYVTNENSPSVSVVDTKTNTVTATYPVPYLPYSAIVSPDGSLLYISNVSKNDITVVDAVTGQIVKEINAGAQPVSSVLSSDGKTLYVANNGSSAISVIDVTTGLTTANLISGVYAYGIRLSADGTKLYVAGTNGATSDLVVMNTVTKQVAATIPTGQRAVGVVLSPDGRYIYLTAAASVRVISTTLYQTVRIIPVGSAPFGISITADGSEVFVANDDFPGTVSIINTASDTVTATIGVGKDPISFGGNFITDNSSCNGQVLTYTITVTPSAAPSVTAGPVTGNISACLGTAAAFPAIAHFMVSGSSLSSAITVTAPANFEVSLSGAGGFAASVAIQPAGGIVAATAVYVRSSATAPAGKVTGNLIVASGPESQQLAIRATINTLPTVNAVSSQTFTAGTTTTPIPLTGNANSYTWTNDNPAVGLAATGTGAIPAFNAINSGSLPVIANIVVTPVSPPYAYVANTSTNSVSVVNLQTGQTETIIPVGKAPVCTSVSPDGSLVYVANSGDNTVSAINTKTNQVTGSCAVNKKPTGLSFSPDGAYLYVTNDLDGNMSVITTADNIMQQEVQTGNQPTGIAADAIGFRSFIANYGDNTVSALAQYPQLGLTVIPVGKNPEGVATSSDASKVYVANFGSDNVTVIDNKTLKGLGNIPVGKKPFAVAVSPDASRVYVTNSAGNSLSVINATDNSIVATIPAGNNPQGVWVSADGNMVYVVNKDSGDITVINAITNSVVNTIPAGPGPVSLSNFIKQGSGCSGAPVKFTITINPNNGPNITVSPVTGNIVSCATVESINPNYSQFVVTGANLGGNVTVTAPVNFEVMIDPVQGFTQTVTIPETNGKVDNITVFVRSASTAPPGNINGKVTLTSPGAPAQQVAVTGLVNGLPVVNPVTGQSVGDGQLTTPIQFTGTGASYSWTNNNTSIGLAATGGGDIAAFKAINKTKQPVTATITATPEPSGYIYVAQGDNSGTLSIISTVSQQLEGTIQVGPYPSGVVLTPDASRVYVANNGNNSISVISTLSRQVIATIPVGNNPLCMAITPDGHKLYVTYGEDDQKVTVINTTTNTVIKDIPADYWNYGITMSHDGQHVYVVNLVYNRVTVINTATDMPDGSFLGYSNQYASENCYAVATNADESRAYVTNESTGTVTVVNTATSTIVTTIQVGAGPNTIISNTDASLMYVANSTGNTVSVIDTKTNKVIATIPVGKGSFGLSFSPDGAMLYCLNYDSGTITAIDPATNKVIATIPAGKNPHSFGTFVSGPTGCKGIPVTFTITVNPPPAPQITTSGSLAPLTTVYGTPSTSTTFTVSGSNMEEAITITAPTGFELSTDGSTFGSSVAVGAAGTIASVTVYIRLAAKTHAGDYSGKITLQSTDATEADLDMPQSTVVPANLSITADDKTKFVGDPNPTLTITYKTFVNGDGPLQLATLPAISTTATIYSQPGQYPITVSGATSTDYAITFADGILNVITPPPTIVVPNTFTPNGDGVNDTWTLKGIDAYSGCTVDVFTRYGQKVYYSTGYAAPWDGKLNGASLPSGTYYYIIDLKNGKIPLSGFVTIIR